MNKTLWSATATTALALSLAAVSGASSAPNPGTFHPKDFLWDECCLSARYTKVVVETINRIHRTIPGCQQLDAASVAYTDTRASAVKRIFVWCNDDPPGAWSFKVIFDTNGRVIRKER